MRSLARCTSYQALLRFNVTTQSWTFRNQTDSARQLKSNQRWNHRTRSFFPWYSLIKTNSSKNTSIQTYCTQILRLQFLRRRNGYWTLLASLRFSKLGLGLMVMPLFKIHSMARGLALWNRRNIAPITTRDRHQILTRYKSCRCLMRSRCPTWSVWVTRLRSPTPSRLSTHLTTCQQVNSPSIATLSTSEKTKTLSKMVAKSLK